VLSRDLSNDSIVSLSIQGPPLWGQAGGQSCLVLQLALLMFWSGWSFYFIFYSILVHSINFHYIPFYSIIFCADPCSAVPLIITIEEIHRGEYCGLRHFRSGFSNKGVRFFIWFPCVSSFIVTVLFHMQKWDIAKFPKIPKILGTSNDCDS
jgi:hypothetical protein